jgi:uracil-DNA glycosylase
MKNSSFKKMVSPSWIPILNQVDEKVLEITEEEYLKIKDKSNIFPLEDKVFAFTNYCDFSDIKVLICGQDPYHQLFYSSEDKLYHPQAMGLAFSVPVGCPVPPSLVNIFNNLQQFKHIDTKPTHGNLESWAKQGVLLMNTSLTVEKSKPNGHQGIWSMFTDELLETITKTHPGLIIVLWGGNAFSKMKIIKNKPNHKFIISSHPSPLGFKNKMKTYGSFYETDHFGQINQYLEEAGKKPIDWNI